MKWDSLFSRPTERKDEVGWDEVEWHGVEWFHSFPGNSRTEHTQESHQRTIPGSSDMMYEETVTFSTQTSKHHIKTKITVTHTD
jgi:hypothetical protein